MSENNLLHIAMWSGPRNISTAMMRSWDNRPDTYVCDEPLYAYFLNETGFDHPIAEEIIADGETDWQKVADWLTGEIPDGKSIFYQKQMTHHLLSSIGRDWLSKVSHCFLIRDPREVITSYLKKNGTPNLEDVGFVQQAEIFDWVKENTGTAPPVLDAKDVLDDPRRMIGLLCDSLNVEFFDSMLSWPTGLRETDGIWAKHWYPEVETSTSFRPYRPKPDQVPDELADIHNRCQEVYEQLYEHRLH